MMSMEMSDSSDLLASNRGGFKNYWRSRTVMEQALLVLTVVEGVMLFGFVIGVASLTSEIVSKDAEIHQLVAELEECLSGNTTAFSTMTSTSPTDTESPTSSTPMTPSTTTSVTTSTSPVNTESSTPGTPTTSVITTSPTNEPTTHPTSTLVTSSASTTVASSSISSSTMTGTSSETISTTDISETTDLSSSLSS